MPNTILYCYQGMISLNEKPIHLILFNLLYQFNNAHNKIMSRLILLPIYRYIFTHTQSSLNLRSVWNVGGGQQLGDVSRANAIGLRLCGVARKQSAARRVSWRTVLTSRATSTPHSYRRGHIQLILVRTVRMLEQVGRLVSPNACPNEKLLCYVCYVVFLKFNFI